MGWIMTNPRRYGTTGLFPSLRQPRKSKYYVTDQLRKAAREYPSRGLNVGACCLQCRRLLDKAQTSARESSVGKRILPESCCDACGRLPIDQALIDKGRLSVQSDPEWALERVKIADMRASFDPGEKIIPRLRETADA